VTSTPPAATPPTPPAAPPAAGPPSPLALLQSRSYVILLVLGALVGIPVAVFAYFFLELVGRLNHWFFTSLPGGLGFDGAPIWWPIPVLVLCGLGVGLSLRYLPGGGGHKPAEGFKTGGLVPLKEFPGVFVAALITLGLGAVLGPEAPLIMMGGVLAVTIVHLIKRDAPDMAILVIGAAGSFAAISTLLISPLAGAFLLLEAAGIGGGLISVMLAPGLLAAGLGALIFIGLDGWTGFGTFALAVPNIPAAGTPRAGEFGWAIAIGLMAAVAGTAIRRIGTFVQPFADRHKVVLTPLLGLVIGGAAVIFAEVSNKSSQLVLFSGQSALAPLIDHAAAYTVGTLLLLFVCKGLAYGLSLGGFRGGPTFPGMFLGAVGGIALSHLPGLPMIVGAGMGIGAMCTVMLGGMPLTSVLLTLLFLSADSLNLVSVVIVAVVVAYVTSARLLPFLKLTPDTPVAAGPAATEPAPAAPA
jgi:H+/Cl- antiporter ClcA